MPSQQAMPGALSETENSVSGRPWVGDQITVNQMRILGHWMRLITIPNQSLIPKAFQEFDEEGRLRPSALYDRIVDVMEELMAFTRLTRYRADYLVDRYSERKEFAAARLKRVNLSVAT